MNPKSFLRWEGASSPQRRTPKTNHRPLNNSSSSSSSSSSVNPSSSSTRDGHRSLVSLGHRGPSATPRTTRQPRHAAKPKFNIGFLLHRGHHSPLTSRTSSASSSSLSSAAVNRSTHFGFQRKSHVFDDDVIRPPHLYVQSVTTIAVLTGIFVLLTVGATVFVALFCCKRNLVFALDDDDDDEEEEREEGDDVCQMEDLEAAAAAASAAAAAVSEEDYEDIEPLFRLGRSSREMFRDYRPLRADFERTSRCSGEEGAVGGLRPSAESRVFEGTTPENRPIDRVGQRRSLGGTPTLGLGHRERQLTAVDNPVKVDQRFREAIHLTGCVQRQNGYQRVMMEEEAEEEEEDERELERVKVKEIYLKENSSKDP